MPSKVNNGWWRRARMRLAARIAPAGAEVRDPQQHLCDCREALLELVCFQLLRADADGEPLAPASFMLDELFMLGAVVPTEHGWELTGWGEQELARMWGPQIIPPGHGGYLGCAEHGVYDAGPGDRWACPECPEKTITDQARPWWSWMISGRMSRYPL